LAVLTVLGGASYLYKQDALLCNAPRWLLHMGCTLFFGALFLKCYRLDRIFHDSTMTRNPLTYTRLMLTLLAMLALDAVVLSLLTLLSPYRVASEHHAVCELESAQAERMAAALEACLGMAKVVLILWCAYINLRLRRLPPPFREFGSVLVLVCNVMVCGVCYLSLQFLVSSMSERNRRVWLCCLVSYAALSSLALLMLPKLAALWRENGRKKVIMEVGASANWNHLQDSLMRTVPRALSFDQVSMKQQQIKKFVTELEQVRGLVEATKMAISAEERRVYALTWEIEYLSHLHQRISRNHKFQPEDDPF